jgi:hypothetical protein
MYRGMSVNSNKSEQKCGQIEMLREVEEGGVRG